MRSVNVSHSHTSSKQRPLYLKLCISPGDPFNVRCVTSVKKARENTDINGLHFIKHTSAKYMFQNSTNQFIFLVNKYDLNTRDKVKCGSREYI